MTFVLAPESKAKKSIPFVYEGKSVVAHVESSKQAVLQEKYKLSHTASIQTSQQVFLRVDGLDFNALFYSPQTEIDEPITAIFYRNGIMIPDHEENRLAAMYAQFPEEVTSHIKKIFQD